jgi:CBS domain-containing protein
MRTARDIIQYKGNTVWSVEPGDTVLHALGVMAEHEIGAVIVLNGEQIVGILTERDYARKVVLAGRSSKASPVADVMTKSVICVAPERTIDECLALMTDKRVRHLPVVDQKQLVGMASIGDLVRARIAEQEHVIEQLQHYIAGY